MVESKHFLIAAEIERAIYRSGRLVGLTWPWLSMAIDLIPDDDIYDPLLSMARSGAHALSRDGLRLDSPLISNPEPDDAEVVLGWCRRVGRQPNSHWAALEADALLDEVMSLKFLLREARFLTVTGQLSETEKAAAIPSLFESAENYDRPKILQVVPIERGDLRHAD